MIYCCALRLWSRIWVQYRSYWFPDLVALSYCARGMAADVREKFGAFSQPKFECGCCEMLVFRVYGVRRNLYVFIFYRNPDVDDRIFDCLPTSMDAVQVEDVRDSFLFVTD